MPHFKAIAAMAMRQILMDAARRRRAKKRGGAGAVVIVTLDDSMGCTATCDTELLELEEALQRLQDFSPRQAQIVVYRYFGGLTVAEVAALFGVSESLIERDCRAAMAWLKVAIRPAPEE